MTWSPCLDYQYLQSYSIHVLSGSEECGGRDSVYDYYDIPKVGDKLDYCQYIPLF